MQYALLVYETPADFGARSNDRKGEFWGAWRVSLSEGSPVLAEAGKNYVASLGTWLVLESSYYLLQFMLSGLVIGLAYGRKERAG